MCMTTTISHCNNNSPATKDDLLKLDNQVCFALYVCSKEIIKLYKPLLEPFALTYTGYITLMALWEQDQVTVKSLGKRLYLDSGTLTPLLKKLEAQGLLVRKRSPEDERNVYISLTEKGHDLKDALSHIPKQLICSSQFKENRQEAKDLLSLLHQFMPK